MTAGTAAGQIAGGVVVSSMTEIMPAVRHGDRRKQAGNCAGLYFGTLTFVSEIIQIFGRSSTGESRPAAEILTVGGMSARHVHEEKRETDDYGQATEQREQG